MKIAVIDNYDSFVYNIVHLLNNLGVKQLDVFKNDKFNMESLDAYDKIVLSPGPGIPKEAGFMPEVIKKYKGVKPILGVCLGHQSIAECFGATLHNLETPLHGISSSIRVLQNDYIFKGIPKLFQVGHYHSWIVKTPLPDCLSILAEDEQGNCMALKHNEYDIRGLQFHPESILTQYGRELLNNWLNY